MKEIVDVLSENLISSLGDEKHGVVVPVAELDDGETVDCKVCCEQMPVLNATSDQDGTHVSNEINMSEEFSKSLFLDAKVQKSLSKSKTFPVSREVQTCSLSTNERADLPGATKQGQTSSASGTSACSRSISLPVSSKCLSYLSFCHVI